MKIAVIGSKGLPPRQGGIEHHCAEIYPRLVEQGHQVVLFGRASYQKQLQPPLQPRPYWSRQSYVYRGVRVVNLPSIPLRGVDALANSAMAAAAATLGGFDIVHFHALGPSLFTWVPRLLTPKTRVVVTCHGLDWQRSKWGKLSSQLILWGERAAVRYAHTIGVVSEELQQYLKATYDRDSFYISNAPAAYAAGDTGSEFSQVYNLEPQRYIVFLGRIVPEKCPELLIRAFQQLRPQGWQLVLVGGNSDTGSYIDGLNRLVGNDPTIHFTGELHGEPLAEVVRGAGLFVLPSEVEGLPLALLEAMREGVPALASDIPVHCQLLGEGRGLLFQLGSVDNCVAAINWATQNPTALATMATRAQNYVQQHHSWDQIADDWLRVYGDLVDQPVLAAPIRTIRS